MELIDATAGEEIGSQLADSCSNTPRRWERAAGPGKGAGGITPMLYAPNDTRQGPGRKANFVTRQYFNSAGECRYVAFRSHFLLQRMLPFAVATRNALRKTRTVGESTAGTEPEIIRRIE
jgi:hypothetical protein